MPRSTGRSLDNLGTGGRERQTWVVTLAPTIGEQGSRQKLSDSASSAARGRIQGIDLARAVAILGMVMVHIGPIRLDGFGLTGAAYRLPVSHASILFVVVAGIGISLLAGDRSRSRQVCRH
jgi:uncharacterized membrane protein